MKKRPVILVGEMTAEERQQVSRELAERLVDLIYQNFDKKMPKGVYENMTLDDTLTVTYEFSFVGNDVAQILGRLRRKKTRRRKAGKL